MCAGNYVKFHDVEQGVDEGMGSSKYFRNVFYRECKLKQHVLRAKFYPENAVTHKTEFMASGARVLKGLYMKQTIQCM